jgi:hypothetical protein
LILLVDEIKMRCDLKVKVIENIEFILKNMAPEFVFIHLLVHREVFSFPISLNI